MFHNRGGGVEPLIPFAYASDCHLGPIAIVDRYDDDTEPISKLEVVLWE